MNKTVSVTELVRNFSDYLNRVTYRGEGFTLVRGTTPAGNVHVEWTYRRIRQKRTNGAEPGAQRRPEVP